MSKTYNKEIMSRIKQQKKLIDTQNKAGYAAGNRKDYIGVVKTVRKIKKLEKSIDKLGSAYVSPKPFVKKNYN